MFDKSTYINRRKQLSEPFGEGILLFLGNDESSMNYADNTYPFRQDSTFLYFFGFHHAPGLAAVIDPAENRAVIFGDEATIDTIVWTGPQVTLKEQAAAVGIDEVRPLARLNDVLSEAAAKKRTIHFLPPYRPEHTLKLSDRLGIAPAAVEENKSIALIKAVVNMRNHKTDEEIAEIDRAATISFGMHVAGMKAAKEGMKEYEVMSVVHQTALEKGCSLSFPIICTTHGETLHNHNYSYTLRREDMLLIDAGAELPSGYCGDVSSTMPVAGKFSDRQRMIGQILAEVHQGAVRALKPGIMYRDIYYEVCEGIVKGMKSLGMMKGDAKEAVRAGAHALFMQCGLGHMMGLDVHDMENLGEVWVGYDGEPKSTQFGIKSLRLARKLEPGFVLTVEPGIYLIPTLIDMWAAEKRFAEFVNYDEVMKWRDFGGVRNEEDYLITDAGYRLLGDASDKTALMKTFY
ncbi:MAG: aminopeptidase P N-terminal domain-containing protein [Tannerella sp.]|nr:aminopeptidase P N-terminal domain-containing protein [Tannerella sp.]